MKYTIVIHQDINGGYWAEAPALPGCVSQGETLAELKENMHEAIEGYLEGMCWTHYASKNKKTRALSRT